MSTNAISANHVGGMVELGDSWTPPNTSCSTFPKYKQTSTTREFGRCHRARTHDRCSQTAPLLPIRPTTTIFILPNGGMPDGDRSPSRLQWQPRKHRPTNTSRYNNSSVRTLVKMNSHVKRKIPTLNNQVLCECDFWKDWTHSFWGYSGIAAKVEMHAYTLARSRSFCNCLGEACNH